MNFPDPPQFYIRGNDELTQPMRRWAEQLNEYVAAVADALAEQTIDMQGLIRRLELRP
jgi:hypothetical protein